MKITNKEILGNIVVLIDKIDRTKARYNGYSDFIENDDFFDAIVLRIAMIGEEVNRLSESFVENNPQVPWKGIVGTRNIIVHGYFDINADMLWDIITDDLPKLKEFCNSKI